MATQYKSYATPVTGTGSGTWGDTLNTGVMGIMDNNMGGIVSKTPAGSDITLTSTEAQMALISLSGSGPSTNINVISSNQGFYFVENLCTGNFTITITNGVAGVVVPKGQRVCVFADTTNGVRIFGYSGFESGTTTVFKQTSAPSGWTKDVANDNKAIRITSGSVSSGGTLGFTSCFAASRSLTGSTAGYTLQIADIPPHTHGVPYFNYGLSNGPAQVPNVAGPGSGNITTTSTGGGGAHQHGAGTLAVQMDVTYVDMIIASRN